MVAEHCREEFDYTCGYVEDTNPASCWLGLVQFFHMSADGMKSGKFGSYFSLSTSDGQMAGSNLVAHSSSVKRSAVAARA